MNLIKIQSNFTVESYAERAKLTTDLRNECARSERGERVDLNQTASKLNYLVVAVNKDRIALGKTKITRELRNAYLAHKKDLTELTSRVNALSEKANGVPTWVRLVGYTALGVGGLVLTAFVTSRFASSPDTSYRGIYDQKTQCEDKMSYSGQVLAEIDTIPEVEVDSTNKITTKLANVHHKILTASSDNNRMDEPVQPIRDFWIVDLFFSDSRLFILIPLAVIGFALNQYARWVELPNSWNPCCKGVRADAIDESSDYGFPLEAVLGSSDDDFPFDELLKDS